MAIAELVMPKLGESIMEATILRWHKKVGDSVKQDETVLDIATDKVDSEVPSTAAGIITEILYNENDVVPIGTVIARINTEVGASVAAAPVAPPQQVQSAPPPPPPAPTTEPAVPYVPAEMATPSKSGANNKFFSPLVLNIANSEGISLSELERIAGSGTEGRVTKRDILQYIEEKRLVKVPNLIPQTKTNSSATVLSSQIEQSASNAPLNVVNNTCSNFLTATTLDGKKSHPSYVVPTGNTEIIEMDRMRKLIAKHMVDSKSTSPHVTSFAEADVTNMVLWRERVKGEFEKREGTKLTFTPMFIECVIKVIPKFPWINASVEADKIIIKKDINIGMATALPSGNLIVPVLKSADQLNIVGLSHAVSEMADAARNNRLKPDDTAGGTFTITNVGTFGSLMGTPIINQPQVAILAVGAIKKRPVVIESTKGDTIGIRHMMYLSLSYDHRIVDGSIGASFLTEVAKEMERWDINRAWYQYV